MSLTGGGGFGVYRENPLILNDANVYTHTGNINLTTMRTYTISGISSPKLIFVTAEFNVIGGLDNGQAQILRGTDELIHMINSPNTQVTSVWYVDGSGGKTIAVCVIPVVNGNVIYLKGKVNNLLDTIRLTNINIFGTDVNIVVTGS